MSLTRLLLIDSHHGFRESARKYLLRCREFGSVEVAASYHEGMLLSAQHFPDLLMIDSEILFKNPVRVKEIEKLKHSNPALEVLVLFLFREENLNRRQELFPLVNGTISKESFADDLFEYIQAGNELPAGKQNSSCKGVD